MSKPLQSAEGGSIHVRPRVEQGAVVPRGRLEFVYSCDEVCVVPAELCSDPEHL